MLMMREAKGGKMKMGMQAGWTTTWRGGDEGEVHSGGRDDILMGWVMD